MQKMGDKLWARFSQTVSRQTAQQLLPLRGTLRRLSVHERAKESLELVCCSNTVQCKYAFTVHAAIKCNIYCLWFRAQTHSDSGNSFISLRNWSCPIKKTKQKLK